MGAKDGVLTIAAVGDFMIERRFASADVEAVRAVLAGPDVVIANVDTVLSDKGTPVPKWANLRGPREAAGDLRTMGIDLIAMANNHAMDFRAEGMLDTLRAFDEAGLMHAGAGANLRAATEPAIVRAGDRTAAILAMACTLPPESAAGPDWPGVAPVHVRHAFVVDETLLTEQPGTVPAVKCWLDEADLARVRADVAAARTRADVVVAVVHWGVPAPWRAPSHPIVQKYQRVLGHALIDAGADAVLGNHAHELHGIEYYREKPIAYCLGNFWIDTIDKYPWMGRESLVLRLEFGSEVAPEVEIAPLLLDEGGVPRPDPSARAVALIARLSAEFGVAVDKRDGRFVVRSCAGNA
jgi:poly-gamma-glutamate capsule biosynthesis protein CapA/YwtB (metallophosphatase superfamily)